jgi:hypothetical protein
MGVYRCVRSWGWGWVPRGSVPAVTGAWVGWSRVRGRGGWVEVGQWVGSAVRWCRSYTANCHILARGVAILCLGSGVPLSVRCQCYFCCSAQLAVQSRDQLEALRSAGAVAARCLELCCTIASITGKAVCAHWSQAKRVSRCCCCHHCRCCRSRVDSGPGQQLHCLLLRLLHRKCYCKVSAQQYIFLSTPRCTMS